MEAQTALKKRQLHTAWEEGLVLPLAEEERPTAILTLTLRTCDRFSRHSVAGELRLGLDGVSVPLGTAQWGELKTSAKVGTSQWARGAPVSRAGRAEVWAAQSDQPQTFPPVKGGAGLEPAALGWPSPGCPGPDPAPAGFSFARQRHPGWRRSTLTCASALTLWQCYPHLNPGTLLQHLLGATH